MSKRRFHLPEDQLHHLYLDQRLTPEAIARQYECSVGTVRCHLKRYGIPLRSPADVAQRDCIEDWILADDECFWAFFAGYVDAEGNIGVYSGQARLRLESADKGILFQSWEKLNSIGVRMPKPRSIPKKGKPLLSTPRKGVARQDLWQLQTKRKASLTTIFAHIGPYLRHADRRRRMEEAIENIRWRNEQFGNRYHN